MVGSGAVAPLMLLASYLIPMMTVVPAATLSAKSTVVVLPDWVIVAASFTQLELQANVPFAIPKGVLKVFPVIVWVTWKSCPAEVVCTVTQ